MPRRENISLESWNLPCVQGRDDSTVTVVACVFHPNTDDLGGIMTQPLEPSRRSGSGDLVTANSGRCRQGPALVVAI